MSIKQAIEALPAFEDARVQRVYAILCSEDQPPGDEHWEGFAARRIVAALRSMPAEPVAKIAPYGYCPQCGAKGVMRERSPTGNTTCENGHDYKSSSALAAPPTAPAPVEGESYEELWNALQEIDTAAVQMPTFKILHEGGIKAVTKNIVAAIRATPQTEAARMSEAEINEAMGLAAVYAMKRVLHYRVSQGASFTTPWKARQAADEARAELRAFLQTVSTGHTNEGEKHEG